jgi:transposase-like protein
MEGCLDGLGVRGLKAPLLCIIDGHAGLRRAVGEAWARAAVQRCGVHKPRNLERKAPRHVLDELRAKLAAAMSCRGNLHCNHWSRVNQEAVVLQ